MLKMAAAGAIALLVTTSLPVYAQNPSTTGANPGGNTGATTGSAEQPNANDAAAFTDARIDIVKSALQLRPDQEKYWPPIENAIRARAKNRQARLASIEQRVEQLGDRGAVEALQNRDPIAFLQRRADALAQRSADLKKVADAWQPLYQTLSPDQKRRMAFLTIFAARELRSRVEERLQGRDSDD